MFLALGCNALRLPIIRGGSGSRFVPDVVDLLKGQSDVVSLDGRGLHADTVIERGAGRGTGGLFVADLGITELEVVLRHCLVGSIGDVLHRTYCRLRIVRFLSEAFLKQLLNRSVGIVSHERCQRSL